MFGLLAGLLAPSAGTILVDGHNPFAEFEWFRGKIGIVFQNDRLLPWRTAVENVEYGLELLHVDSSKRRRAALDWLDRLGLAAPANDLPPHKRQEERRVRQGCGSTCRYRWST